jgi:hypothetical protein
MTNQVNITEGGGSVTIIGDDNNQVTVTSVQKTISLEGGGAPTSFTSLTDTPNLYASQSGKIVRVNSGEDGLEFVDPEVIENVNWGEITGTLTDQTDLVNYIAAQTPTLNLQDVTDNGATTTNNITIDGGGLVNSALHINGSVDSTIRSTSTEKLQLVHNGNTVININQIGDSSFYRDVFITYGRQLFLDQGEDDWTTISINEEDDKVTFGSFSNDGFAWGLGEEIQSSPGNYPEWMELSESQFSVRKPTYIRNDVTIEKEGSDAILTFISDSEAEANETDLFTEDSVGFVIQDKSGFDLLRVRDSLGNDDFIIDNAGRVGIGMTPSFDLSVDGSIYSSGDVFVDNQRGFYAVDTANGYTGIWVNGDDGNEELRLYTADNQRLTINKDGNVGIGTTNPASLLSVGGTGESGTFSVSGIDTGTIANFRDVDGENVFKTEGSVGTGDLLIKFGDMDGANNEHYFAVDEGNQKTYFMNGDIGIGTNSPATLLDVAGTITATGVALGDNKKITLGDDGASDAYLEWDGIELAGYSAGDLYLQTADGANIRFGLQAGLNLGTGTRNIWFGTDSGNGATNIDRAVGIGVSAGRGQANSDSSVFIGDFAGYQGTTNPDSVMIGKQAGYQADNNIGVTFIGNFAGYQSDDVDNSVLIGNNTGRSMSNVGTAVAIGNRALFDLTNAIFPVGIGYDALKDASNADYTIGIGYRAGDSVAQSDDSILIGMDAGSNTTGNTNSMIAIGELAGNRANDAQHSIFIGFLAGLQDTVDNTKTGAITTATISNGGSGYAVNDTVSIDGGNDDSVITVNAVSAPGISDFYVYNPGYGYGNYGSQTYEFVTITQGSAFAYGAVYGIGSNGEANYLYLYSGTESGTFTTGVADIISSTYGTGGQIFITSLISGGVVEGVTITDGGSGYLPNNGVSTSVISSSGSGLILNVTATDESGDNGTSIVIGEWANTGGYRDSITIGRGTKNSEERHLNIGNVLQATGVYASDVVSSTLVTNSKVTVSKLNIKNIPTSASGLSSGDVWNDGGTLKIVS